MFCLSVSLFNGHLNFSFYVKSSMSPDDQFLISGSSDRCAYIWRVSFSCASQNLRGCPACSSAVCSLCQLSLEKAETDLGAREGASLPAPPSTLHAVPKVHRLSSSSANSDIKQSKLPASTFSHHSCLLQVADLNLVLMGL